MATPRVLSDVRRLVTVILPQTRLWTSQRDRMVTHSELGLDVKTESTKHTRGYQKATGSHGEALWGQQTAAPSQPSPTEVHNGSRGGWLGVSLHSPGLPGLEPPSCTEGKSSQTFSSGAQR